MNPLIHLNHQWIIGNLPLQNVVILSNKNNEQNLTEIPFHEKKKEGDLYPLHHLIKTLQLSIKWISYLGCKLCFEIGLIH